VAGVASCRDVTRPGSREEKMADKMERVTTDGQLENVVRIEQFTFRVWTAIWTSSGQFVLRPEPVSNIKPRRTAPLPHDRDPHGFTEKTDPVQQAKKPTRSEKKVFQTPRLDRFFTNPIQITSFCGAINLKEYRADFAFEESIQNMKLCANSGSHQALASTRFLHKTCSQGKGDWNPGGSGILLGEIGIPISPRGDWNPYLP
ncbi:hypothetical protein Bbelb_099860, partial [Branchiostoma belcheri]